MNIARPRGGFKVATAATVNATIEAACLAIEPFRRFWGDVIDRLRFTAHIEGVGLRGGAGGRVIAFAADEVKGIPRTLVAYTVLGDRVTISRVLVEDAGLPKLRPAYG